MQEVSIPAQGVTGEEGMCGCSGKASRGRVLCPEARAMKAEMGRLLELEFAAKDEFGPASPERKEIMFPRLRAKEAFYGHLTAVDRSRRAA